MCCVEMIGLVIGNWNVFDNIGFDVVGVGVLFFLVGVEVEFGMFECLILLVIVDIVNGNVLGVG